MKLKDISDESLVLRWVNYQLSHMSNDITNVNVPSQVDNFTSDFTNCEVLLLLLHKARGDKHIDVRKMSV